MGKISYALLLFIGAVIFGFPIFWMVRGSLISQAFWMKIPVVWLPPLEELSLSMFKKLFCSSDFRMQTILFNTGFIAVVGMIFNIVFDCMAGFALAKMNLPGKKILVLLLMITLMVPFESMMVALYLVVARIGLANSMAGIILPISANVFSIILIWRFFEKVPNDIIEAARVDGAGWGKILFTIAMPLATPAISTIAILQFLVGWESFVWPMLITDPNSKFDVLPKVIANATYSTIGGASETEWPYVMAAGLISTLPIIMVFIFGQRFFIKGLTGGSVKG